MVWESETLEKKRDRKIGHQHGACFRQLMSTPTYSDEVIIFHFYCQYIQIIYAKNNHKELAASIFNNWDCAFRRQFDENEIEWSTD